MKIEGLLPIGSVVLLKDSTHRVMVIGFYQQKIGEPGRVFDYVGCLYPEGFLSADENLLFDHAQIERMFSVGYMDGVQFEYMEKLGAAIERFRKGE